MLDGFYRTGHLHWQYEGDFFGLYRDAYYGENIDIYNGDGARRASRSPARSRSTGLKVAFGPQLWWGANPAVFVKYQRQLGGIDCDGHLPGGLRRSRRRLTSSIAIPEPQDPQGLAADCRRSLGPSASRSAASGPGSHEDRRDLPADRRGP